MYKILFTITFLISTLNSSEYYSFRDYVFSSYLSKEYTDKETFEIEKRNKELKSDYKKENKFLLGKKIALLEAKKKYIEANKLKKELKKYLPRKPITPKVGEVFIYKDTKEYDDFGCKLSDEWVYIKSTEWKKSMVTIVDSEYTYEAINRKCYKYQLKVKKNLYKNRSKKYFRTYGRDFRYFLKIKNTPLVGLYEYNGRQFFDVELFPDYKKLKNNYDILDKK